MSHLRQTMVRQALARVAVQDYHGYHQPWEEGARAHEITKSVPDDVYENPHYYTGFRQWLPETMGALRRARGNPSAVLRVYRAAPPFVEAINTGDWVTFSLAYAKEHSKYGEDEGWTIRYAEVPARDVAFGGDDLMEWGYFGPSVPSRVAT